MQDLGATQKRRALAWAGFAVAGGVFVLVGQPLVCRTRCFCIDGRDLGHQHEINLKADKISMTFNFMEKHQLNSELNNQYEILQNLKLKKN